MRAVCAATLDYSVSAAELGAGARPAVPVAHEEPDGQPHIHACVCCAGGGERSIHISCIAGTPVVTAAQWQAPGRHHQVAAQLCCCPSQRAGGPCPQLALPGAINLDACWQVLNTKFPEIGELLLHRLLKQWVRAYTRNDKPIILAVSKFIAHLVNQQVQGVCQDLRVQYSHVCVQGFGVKESCLRCVELV